MKVLLLGATGLLGHNVLLRLMEEGHQVVALVRRADGIHLPQGTWETVVGSLLDYNTLEKAAEGCDAIVAAMGATPKFPAISGLLDESGKPVAGVYNPIEVYGREQELGRNVVVIGGGEIGMETAMYLAENGHEVTILSRQRKFAAEAGHPGFRKVWLHLCADEQNLFGGISHVNYI